MRACGRCGSTTEWSPRVVAVIVYAPSLDGGFYVLLPAEEYSLCGDCDAAMTFVLRALASHPATSAANDWTSANIEFADERVRPWHLERHPPTRAARA